MGFLSRFTRKDGSAVADAESPERGCPHGSLVPHWDTAGDIGKADRVVRYTCESCQATFSREEGERVQAQAAERVLTP